MKRNILKKSLSEDWTEYLGSTDIKNFLFKVTSRNSTPEKKQDIPSESEESKN